uniref:Uncharacterized protein n=1 Tax=Setaria viridis TaxID=4556 RepID=A0A4U6TWM1_SETVI|nr:hypothetical protein SEVIR_7G213151v2 [Setaria viridis]
MGTGAHPPMAASATRPCGRATGAWARVASKIHARGGGRRMRPRRAHPARMQYSSTQTAHQCSAPPPPPPERCVRPYYAVVQVGPPAHLWAVGHVSASERPDKG